MSGRPEVIRPDDAATEAAMARALDALAVLLVFALEGSTATGATLIATTITTPRPRVCGWTVRDGWLHPMETGLLEVALIPCPGTEAKDRDVYTAPPLIKPSGTHKDNAHG
ncbi:hypothetical protein [Streptomyces sp. NPDC048489]|uniref:hypothetical protein n=1 Tax=Streptomyces sp. NPDC048489 TaxID=3154504 RepID=UPI003446F726